MKFLIAGDWHSMVHEEPMALALESLGHRVDRFGWHSYFTVPSAGIVPRVAGISLRAQHKFLAGPVVNRMNDDLVARAAASAPDVLFVYRGTHVFPATIERIKALRNAPLVAGYNNDDPFAPQYPKYLWRHFRKGLPLYDLVLAYRAGNIDDLARAGAKRVELLRSWFVPNIHRPACISEEERREYGSDVVFVGHYEPDGRLELLEAAARAGWKVRIFGPARGFRGFDWEGVVRRSRWLREIPPVRLVWGEEYNKALCASRVALCFFSKLNRDTYTRRCFEIPATGTLMLSEYSEDLAGMFTEAIEADFFRNEQEFLAKLQLYLMDDERRRSVAAAGRRRVYEDGHDVVSRMREVVRWLEADQQV